MVAARLLTPNDAWKKARLAMEANRPQAARGAITIAAPDALPLFEELNASAAKFLTGRAFVAAKSRKELVVLALVKVAIADPEQAATQLDSKWGPMLSAEERNWLWGTIGRAGGAEALAAGRQLLRQRDEELGPLRRHARLARARRAARRPSGRRWRPPSTP
jgi:soluble lytic murein transglycosylase